MDIERKLVTLRQVSEIRPIPNADNIELAVVDGWQCVVKKNEFKQGDEGIYFEIDSFIPTGLPMFEFLKKDAREWNGKLGTRIKTIKLRGQISQGILLPIGTFGNTRDPDKISKALGVIKWEREIPVQEIRQDSWLDSIIRFFTPKKYRKQVFDFIYFRFLKRKGGKKSVSSFPSFIPKTDEERIQNIIKYKLETEGVYEVTTKMNGSSMTAYVKDGVFGHCSRNVKLGLEDGSNFSKVVKKYDLQNKMLGEYNVAIQGEMCGPGVQGNYEQLEDHDFFVFRVWDIDKQKYLPPYERDSYLAELTLVGIDLKKVPNLGLHSLSKFKSIDDYLAFSEGPGLNRKDREGVVFQAMDGSDSFKVISNSYLLKGGD